MFKRAGLLVSMLALLVIPAGASGQVFFVSQAGDGSDGLTWATAFTTIQAGIDAAATGDEVLVAQGTFFENITMKDGVALKGGYSGQGMERDWDAFPSVIDGNQGGNVVSIVDCPSPSTLVDGFTIQNGSDSGISCQDSSPTISHNRIRQNQAMMGGGIYAISLSDFSSNPNIFNNRITENYANEGGGIYQQGKTYGIIANNVIAWNSGNAGGGIRLHYICGPTIVNNALVGNTATLIGGAVSCNYVSCPTMYNNVIALSNSGIYGALASGGIYENNLFFQNGEYDLIDYVDPEPAYYHTALNRYGDPLMADIQNGDFHLLSGSPCVDAGNDAVWAATIMIPHAEDFEGEARINGTKVDIGVDESPFFAPATEIAFAGTEGANGWYLSDVAAVLSASDQDGTVTLTEYSLDGETWTPYSGEFTLSQEGPNLVWYRSTDDAGHREWNNTAQADIDRLTPSECTGEVSYGVMGENGYYVSQVSVSFSGYDPVPGSGIDHYEYSLDGVEWISTFYGVSFNYDGDYTLDYTCSDAAGNYGPFGTLNFKIDRTYPMWSAIDPPAGAVDVPPETVITVTFTEDVYPGSNYELISLKNNKQKFVGISKAIVGNVLTITPTEVLSQNKTYIWEVPQWSIKDVAGNEIPYTLNRSFTTGSK